VVVLKDFPKTKTGKTDRKGIEIIAAQKLQLSPLK
jgi:hypothetical protein